MQITQLLSITFCLNTMKKPGKRLQMNPVEASCEKSFTWMGFIAAPPLIVHVFIVIGFTSKQDIFTIYQSHVTINSVKTFHCQLLHFFEFYDLIFFDGYSVYQQMGYKNPCYLWVYATLLNIRFCVFKYLCKFRIELSEDFFSSSVNSTALSLANLTVYS